MHLNMKTFLMMVLAGWFALAGTMLHAQGAKKKGVLGKRSRKRAAPSALNGTQKVHVTFNPTQKRDPMLSPDDILLLEHREKQRLAALEAERRRKEEEERKRLAEEERKRQWELMLLKDPTILVRDKIKIGGIIDKEVLIGGKLYTIGNSYMGAKIVAVGADSVTFSYKGHKFVKKLSL